MRRCVWRATTSQDTARDSPAPVCIIPSDGTIHTTQDVYLPFTASDSSRIQDTANLPVQGIQDLDQPGITEIGREKILDGILEDFLQMPWGLPGSLVLLRCFLSLGRILLKAAHEGHELLIVLVGALANLSMQCQ